MDNGDGNLSVNFVLDGSETLHQMSLKVSDDLKQNGEKYMKYLQSALEGRKEAKEPESFYRAPQPQLNPVPLGTGGYIPMQPLRPSPLAPDPFPGGGLYNPSNEYVGPNSGVFRGTGGVLGPTSSDRPLNIPPGARYDPTSPFDLRGLPPEPGSTDPTGFDEFGRPTFPQRPGRGGFGGGFGTGFGGFGGDLGGRRFM